MPNLKDIRRRIKSVKNTQKITQAMRMVAAAKVRRAENRVKAARPYTLSLAQVFGTVFQSIMHHMPDCVQSSRYQRLFHTDAIKSVGILVCSSDRGLCGSYNASILRQAFRLEREIRQRGWEPKFYLVGNKAIQSFARHSNAVILGRMGGMTAAPTVHEARHIMDTLLNAFLNREIDTLSILSTHFKSMISYKVQVTPLIPVKPIIDWEPELIPSLEDVHAPAPRDLLKSELVFEPNALTLLEELLPMYLSSSIYTSLLEGAASELAARMTAMSNATTNAGEMINQLTIQYNKARQAAITQEILEIVGGAEALV